MKKVMPDGSVLDGTPAEIAEYEACVAKAGNSSAKRHPDASLPGLRAAVAAGRADVVGDPVQRRSKADRLKVAHHFLIIIRDAGDAGVSGAKAADLLKVKPKGLGGVLVVLKGEAQAAGLRSLEEAVVNAGRLPDGGSLWKRGAAISKLIDHLYARLDGGFEMEVP